MAVGDAPQEILIADILIGTRKRKDFGDIDKLIKSIDDIGLQCPIALTSGNSLIHGGRRIEAYRRLGFISIPAVWTATREDALSLLKAERDENTCREPFTFSESMDMGRAIEELESENAKGRQGNRNDLTSGPVGPEVLPAKSIERVRDVVGAAIGMSGRQYERAKDIMSAASEECDNPAEVRKLARELVNGLDSGAETIRGAHDKLREKRSASKPVSDIISDEQLNELNPPPSKYDTSLDGTKILMNAANRFESAAEYLPQVDPTTISDEDKKAYLRTIYTSMATIRKALKEFQ
jgi:hypothetical protein